MKALKASWLFLVLFFLIGSFILLLNTIGHHHNDLLLRVFILLPLLLLVPQVQKVIKHSDPILLFVLLLFVLLHAMPFVLTMQMHHQETSQSQHPCCVPQAAALVTSLFIGFAGLLLFKKKENKPLIALSFAHVVLTARAPPHSM